MAYEPAPQYKQQADWGGIVTYGDDSHLVVMFYMRSVPNALKSRQAGTRFCDSVPYVKMHAPGENLQIIDRPVREDDRMRFPRQWQAFQENREQISDGIPIDMLFPSYPNIGDNLRSCGVHTVEQCANMSANAMDTIGMGAQEYKNRAKDYLEAASAGANYHKFTDQLDAKDREIARLKKDMDALSAQFQAIMAQIGAGRPVPAALVPQAGVPGIANFQPLHGLPAAQGAPTRGEEAPPVEPRKDLMAEIPATGRIKPRAWGQKEK